MDIVWFLLIGLIAGWLYHSWRLTESLRIASDN
jgi:uncharacterized membrane protein YeaQ/YmgE (transglycosylase-associated protein family)